MKLGSNFWYGFWLIIAVLVMVLMFIFGYHSPIETNEESKNIIYTELSNDTVNNYDSILPNTIKIDPYIGSLDNKEVQDFSFTTIKDSITTNYNGWLILSRKPGGFNIDSIIVVNK